jgi:hypothetical protein
MKISMIVFKVEHEKHSRKLMLGFSNCPKCKYDFAYGYRVPSFSVLLWMVLLNSTFHGILKRIRVLFVTVSNFFA